jgi:cyclic beta-1,2-glucan synthetase
VGLGEAFGAGLDPCAAIQVHLDLGPEEECTFHFLLGEGESRDAALGLIGRYRSPEEVERARDAVDRFWEDYLGRVEVRTPAVALDVMLNRWLPYQAVVCRLWGRSALYQSSGAFGFRDQLQDTLSLFHRDPGAVRRHILHAARHQFVEGDVLHWWHPSTEEGVRTRCSDDLLWLPWVTAAYVDATGDEEILEEPVPYLDAPTLAEGEIERYRRFPEAPEPRPLYEHCLQALRRGATRGAHGLPLMGTGDWNDGMDRVGEEGRGESVWLAWFLHACLDAFSPIAQRRGDVDGAAFLAEEAERLRQAAEATAWDGHWYRRGYFDDGTPLGSAKSEESRIDSLTQSWAVLSGAADPARARQAIASVQSELVRERERLVLLLAPPFDRTELEPGYIKAYPPGIRENGGQYTHAAIWLAWAYTVLGDGATAGRLLRFLNPVLRTRTPEDVARYRVEPYVVAADIYGAEPHVGRGGWTWYTGSSGWLYRLGVEAVLGIRPTQGGIRCAPCIPPDWPGFEVILRRDDSEIHVRVDNPEGGCSEVVEVTVDGRSACEGPVPFLPGRHEVVVRLGGAREPGTEA